MRLLVAVGCVLTLAPAAHADSIVFATDGVRTPTHVMQLAIDGGGERVVAASGALDRAADGALLTADATRKTLLVDGRPVAHVDWPIDEARFSPDGRQVVFTAVALDFNPPSAPDCASCSHCYEYCTNSELWFVERDGSALRELSDDGRLPRFSPDGRHIAYLQGHRGQGEAGYGDVHVVDPYQAKDGSLCM